jgi:hypothetical protein
MLVVVAHLLGGVFDAGRPCHGVALGLLAVQPALAPPAVHPAPPPPPQPHNQLEPRRPPPLA